MGNIINTIQDENGIYKQDTVNQQVTTEILQDVAALSHALQASNNELSYQIMQHNTLLASVENANQRYINAENNRQWIYNNEVETYNTLLNNQNNLLTRINQYKVKLWRYKNKLYYRTNSGELIIKNQVEMQKELSSRYGLDVYIVYDLNDVLQNNTQLRVNTVFIAINCLLVVDQEIVEPNNKNEILQYTDGTVKRNLLAHTRYKKDRLLNNSTSGAVT